MPAKMFPHLKLLYLLFMVLTQGKETVFLIKFSVFFTIKAIIHSYS
jgi:hypothetical protein